MESRCDNVGGTRETQLEPVNSHKDNPNTYTELLTVQKGRSNYYADTTNSAGTAKTRDDKFSANVAKSCSKLKVSCIICSVINAIMIFTALSVAGSMTVQYMNCQNRQVSIIESSRMDSKKFIHINQTLKQCEKLLQ